VKFVVVPESSERCTAVIAVPGSWASGLSATRAGSFHVVMAPLKMPATVAGERLSSSTPGRL
jgi:hypothetical protein